MSLARECVLYVAAFWKVFDIELSVAVLWEGISNFLRVGNRSFWGLGGPGGPGDPSERWGAKPPTFLVGLQGPRGHPEPKNARFPAPQKS